MYSFTIYSVVQVLKKSIVNYKKTSTEEKSFVEKKLHTFLSLEHNIFLNSKGFILKEFLPPLTF